MKDETHFKMPTTDEEARNFIQLGLNSGSAPRDLYDTLRQVGYSIEDALIYVLNCQCKQPEKNAELTAKYGH